MTDSELLKQHLKALDDIHYTLDFRDLYNFHRDIWINIDHGTYIPITEMSTAHLVNSLAMIERGGIRSCYGLGPLWLPKIVREIQNRINKNSET